MLHLGITGHNRGRCYKVTRARLGGTWHAISSAPSARAALACQLPPTPDSSWLPRRSHPCQTLRNGASVVSFHFRNKFSKRYIHEFAVRVCELLSLRIRPYLPLSYTITPINNRNLTKIANIGRRARASRRSRPKCTGRATVREKFAKISR